MWKRVSVQGSPVCLVLDVESEPSLGMAQLEMGQETSLEGLWAG